ncbi:hypothetical protein F511_12638 [Dorcoceras hygrometricum]|uniref:Uncharacterized protein n=1 Tax=Dorcoceras hygrometricum TaxID=472368 RepID=A0A2Z7CXN6_9LAMI|nr:hypothetical protein F511_12638 [Dorcoceras hygrometricum]
MRDTGVTRSVSNTSILVHTDQHNKNSNGRNANRLHKEASFAILFQLTQSLRKRYRKNSSWQEESSATTLASIGAVYHRKSKKISSHRQSKLKADPNSDLSITPDPNSTPKQIWNLTKRRRTEDHSLARTRHPANQIHIAKRRRIASPVASPKHCRVASRYDAHKPVKSEIPGPHRSTPKHEPDLSTYLKSGLSPKRRRFATRVEPPTRVTKNSARPPDFTTASEYHQPVLTSTQI